MKILCDVCERAPAMLICCADEAALCAECDVDVHAANKLASKHQRLLLQSLPGKLPLCDICREKPAFIFCVEDRALFCQDCNEPIHPASSLSANHQRFLATGIKVAFRSSTSCPKDAETTCFEPPVKKRLHPVMNNPQQQHQKQPSFASSWPGNGMDEALQFPNYKSSDKKEQLEVGDLDWIDDIGIFGDQIPLESLAAAEVPQLSLQTSHHYAPYQTNKSGTAQKIPRIDFPNEDNEYFTVPDLG